MRYDSRALRRLLAERGLSASDLAARVRITRQAVSAIARGSVTPNARTLAKLAHALGVPVGAFFAERPARRSIA